MDRKERDRIANETTIHGIKETYYAFPIGRIFWVVAFIGCCTVMVFQLQSVFQSYLGEAIGTRITDVSKAESLEIPSVYYCNEQWMPLVEAFEQLLNSDSSKDLSKLQEEIDQCLQIHSQTISASSTGHGGHEMKSMHMAGETTAAPMHNHDMGSMDMGGETTTAPMHNHDMGSMDMGGETTTAPMHNHDMGSMDMGGETTAAPMHNHDMGSMDMGGSSTMETTAAPMLNHDMGSMDMGGSSTMETTAAPMFNHDMGSMDMGRETTMSPMHHHSMGGNGDMNEQTCAPHINYLRSVGKLEYLNSIIMADDPARKKRDYAKYKITQSGYTAFGQVYQQVLNTLNTEHGSSPQKLAEDVTAVSSYHPGHSIMTEKLCMPEHHGTSSGDHQGHHVHSHMSHSDMFSFWCRGKVATNLNGVCWEFKPSEGDTWLAMRTHYVLHFGARGHILRLIAERYGIEEAIAYYMRSHKSGVSTYSTFAALASQSDPGLYFKQKLRLDDSAGHAHISFWTKKTAFLNTRKYTCEGNGWTELDQARCHQQRIWSGSNHKEDCKQRLPPSTFYPGLQPVSAEDCSGLSFLKEKLLASGGNESANSPHIQNKFLQRILPVLTKNSKECPRPCRETVFNFDISYRAPTATDQEMCGNAIAAMLTEDPGTETVGPEEGHNMHSGHSMHKRETNAAGQQGAQEVKEWPHAMVAKQMENYAAIRRIWPFWNDTSMFPCTVVMYEQAELHGTLYEEYYLYNIADVASSFGGTVGLWIGASALSVVQIVYLLCLERLLRKKGARMQGVDGQAA